MNRPEYILNEVRKETDSVILFTSLTGKDSILLTYYCAQIFARVVCVYMYVVKGLSYALKYQKYFEGRFTNLNYLHVPHFALASYIKSGYMGIASDTKQKRITLAQLNDLVIEKTGIKWTIFGMKQNDSLNRRLQLRGYELNAICRKSNKVYPLSELSNKQVCDLIELNRLPRPLKFDSGRSQGESVRDINYLLWLQKSYPEDLLKVFRTFPATRQLIYQHEHKTETANQKESA
ncbi:MAG: hypothetical protein BWY70_01794 [Bacteroidetes bacterium ADurb.Bin408]|nr:MAG: hypothetical protein BWY70_01794 [Bacteroidetes bacterium ADurb.Bin408]